MLRFDKSTRLLMFAPVALILAAGLIYSGCAKGISGDSYVNSPPQVRFVNVPPNGSTFSANPIISWVGTDIDGRVTEYRYAVFLTSEIEAALGPNPSDSAAKDYAVLPTNADRWKSLTVTLDNPANRDTVRLSADFVDPVNVIVEQYVFLMAFDDGGARSEVVLRVFGRNDHFPQTGIDPFLGPYVNIDEQKFGLGGIPAKWVGQDEIDFPNADDPPLEYEWRLYGPYTNAESTMIVSDFLKVLLVTPDRTYELGDTLVDTLFDFTRADTTIDSSVTPYDTTISVAIDSVFVIPVDTLNQSQLSARNGKFDTIIVTDSLKALDAAIGLDTLTESRLVRSSFNPLTGDVWVRDRNTLFFSIFDDDPLVIPGSEADTTRELTFLFWVRARDDAFVPDPTPSFGVFNAIEARHERDLLIIDMAKLASNFNINGIWTPCERALAKLAPGAVRAKNMYADFYNAWLDGTVGPDNTYGFDTGTFDPCGDDSGFVPPGSPCDDPLNGPTGSSPDYLLGAGLPIGNPFVPTLRDILKHKVILIVKEHVQSALPMKAGSFGETWLLEGVLAGVNFWVMSRAPFQRFPFNSVEPYCYGVANQEVPLVYAQVFGLQGGCYQSWYGMAVQRGIDQQVDSTLPDPVRNEDFIGAVPAERFASQFPELTVDCDNLRDNIRWASRDDCIFVLPNIQYPYIDTICALPEVGYTIPITPAGTEGMYLYKSRFGEAKYPFWDLAIDDYQGTVVAVRRDAGQFRAAHWQVTPSGLAHDSFKVAFNGMMDWLFAEPWGGPSITTGPIAARRTTTEREYSPELARYAEILKQRRQERLQEILPPGQTTVKDQFEFEKSLKRWQRMNQAAQAAELNSGY